MKEKKNEKKEIKQIDEMPSQGKIIGAWILLIVLIACTAGLVYLKNNNQTELQIEEENKITVPPAVTSALTDIVDKFNTSSLVNDYKQDGLTLTASLNEMTITVTYVSENYNGSVNYTYNVSGNLSVAFTNNDKEINDKIFKTMVIACRERINLTEDVTTKLDDFLTNDTEVYGLKSEIINDSINYYIDIRYPAEEPETNTQTNTTDNNESNNEVIE